MLANEDIRHLNFRRLLVMYSVLNETREFSGFKNGETSQMNLLRLCNWFDSSGNEQKIKLLPTNISPDKF